jgi:hypothetical protein
MPTPSNSQLNNSQLVAGSKQPLSELQREMQELAAVIDYLFDSSQIVEQRLQPVLHKLPENSSSSETREEPNTMLGQTLANNTWRIRIIASHLRSIADNIAL